MEILSGDEVVRHKPACERHRSYLFEGDVGVDDLRYRYGLVSWSEARMFVDLGIGGFGKL